jgi:dTDP-4-dehydrorhamnose 3,5-epimerase
VKIVATDLPGVVIIEPKVFGDERGFFYESYNERDFREKTGLDVRFVQDNHSRSARGVLRGLHYQIQWPQGKLVRATVGAVYDVVVDVRKSSPTFGKWLGFELSAENKLSVWIPPGYAHGFLVTSNYAELQYKTTDYWAPTFERCIRWNDSQIGISWPFIDSLILSEKDKSAPDLRLAQVFP